VFRYAYRHTGNCIVGQNYRTIKGMVARTRKGTEEVVEQHSKQQQYCASNNVRHTWGEVT